MLYHFLVLNEDKYIHVNTRLNFELGKSDNENEDSDLVELEKSNVLLMGPTGSGIVVAVILLVVLCSINKLILIVASSEGPLLTMLTVYFFLFYLFFLK